jgi:hypothetical protein
MKVEVTNHALERFVERGGLLYPDPEASLRELVESGQVLREKTSSGHVLVQAAGLRFVCDRKPGSVLVVVTVLNASDAEDEGDALVAVAEDYSAEAAQTLQRLVAEEERLTHETRRAELVFAALQKARNSVRKAIRQLAGEDVVQ